MRARALLQFARITAVTVTVLCGAFGAGPAHAAPGDGYSGVKRLELSDAESRQALDYWTPERMASAVSLDAVADGAPLPATGRAPIGNTPARGPRGPVTNTSAPVAPATGVTPRANDQPTDGLPTVGALFFTIGPLRFRCTGTVINTASKNIIATAAHCIWNRPAAGLPPIPLPNPVFVPQYHSGQRPFGTWAVQTRYITTDWSDHLNPDQDWGFIKLKPLNGRTIQDTVGANGWRSNNSYENPVEITAYPGDRDRPLQCYAFTKQAQNFTWQITFPCDHFTDGVSGSLLLTEFGCTYPDLGITVADLGGYQQGGNTPDISYAVLWSRGTAVLINYAVTH